MELVDVLDIEALGGFVTKSITLEARLGNPAPRVAEFESGMINSVGLANPGLARVRSDKLPWIAANVRRAKVLVSVAGHTVEEYFELIEGLDEADGFVGFEINLSCPNDARRDGVPFALDLDAVTEIIATGGAHVRHAQLIAPGTKANHKGHIGARLGRDSQLNSHIFSLGGALARTDLHVRLAEPGATCKLDGLYLARDAEQLDHYVQMDHASPHTRSEAYYKGVADNKGVGGFVGRVLIARGAHGSSSEQLNNNLLLRRVLKKRKTKNNLILLTYHAKGRLFLSRNYCGEI